MCSQFPGVSTHWPSAQSGLVLQELGQAIQVLATRYSLDLLPQGSSETVKAGSHITGQNTGVITETLCQENVRRDSKGRSDGFIDKLPLSSKTSKSAQQSGNVKKDAENTKVPEESESESAGCKVSEEVAVSESREMENITNDDEKNDLSRNRIGASENKTKVLDEIGRIPGTGGEGEDGEKKGKESTVEATFSPAHSRESMKTVGPLEKVSASHYLFLCILCHPCNLENFEGEFCLVV